MRGGRLQLRTGVILIGMGLVMTGAGCASKQVASTSGDQATTMKGKGEPAAASESVKQEPMASIESGAPLGGLAAREPAQAMTEPGRGTVPSGGTAPSGSTLPESSASASSSVAGPASTAGLGDIYFDFDQYNIRSDAQTVLDTNARWLRGESGKSLLIEGHCDERGTLAYNLVLGEKRAKAAKRYLEDLGIPASRMKTTSYGEVRPVCKEQHEGCYSKNRRAHFVVQ